MPPYLTHLVLLEHDRVHGNGVAKLGERVHWLRTWLVQRTRQWSKHDVIVCGANPVLGALACAGLVNQGRHPLWMISNDFDAWDYPLAIAGAHDDLLAQAGLPPMGAKLFDVLGSMCVNRAQTVWGLNIQYEFEREKRARFCFAQAQKMGIETWGAARMAAHTMAARGFKHIPQLPIEVSPRRHGGIPKLLVIECQQVVWTSDRRDGVSRWEAMENGNHGNQLNEFKEKNIRLGRARWHAQTVEDFAKQSREDLKHVLALGAWK